MYEVKEKLYESFKLIDLIDYSQNTVVTIAPERGGIVISFKVNDIDILYLNETSFIKEGENIRGGIPILFPSAGRLINQKYEWNGLVYEMPNHGFARDLNWEIIDQSNENAASVTIKVKSNEQTFIHYPFHFEVIYTYVLKDNQLKIEQKYKNKSINEMPFHLGFHPYFRTSTHQLEYETDAAAFFDDSENILYPMTKEIDMTNKNSSCFLVKAKTPKIRFRLPEIDKTIEMKYGTEFKYVVLWTEPEAEFICVEPWSAKPNELNRKKELLIVQPGEQLDTHVTIGVD